MIERIKSLKNVGSFENNQPSDEVKFSTFTLIFGENGRGKTTIVSILRSASLNDPKLVMDRQRLGSTNSPEIIIEHNGSDTIFENESWNNTIESISIFDDSFVSSNVCSGMEIDSSHRKGLHELIIGEQGVQLFKNLQVHKKKNEKHNEIIKELKTKITAYDLGPNDVDKFCNLKKIVDIDNKILDLERRIEASKSADLIRQQLEFQELSIPDFDDKELIMILDRDLPSLESEAADHVQNHIAKLGNGGEKWTSDGTMYIDKITESLDIEVCPYCTQELSGVEIIQHYRGYFSDGYKKLNENIEQTFKLVSNTHEVKVQSSFKDGFQKTLQTPG